MPHSIRAVHRSPSSSRSLADMGETLLLGLLKPKKILAVSYCPAGQEGDTSLDQSLALKEGLALFGQDKLTVISLRENDVHFWPPIAKQLAYGIKAWYRSRFCSILYAQDLNLAGIVVVWLARLVDKPSILRLSQVTEPLPETAGFFARWQERLNRRTAKEATAVVVSSGVMKQQLGSWGIPETVITVIPPSCFIPPELPSRDVLREKLEVEGLLVVTIMSVIELDAFRPVIDALAALPRKNLDLKWLIIGEGPAQPQLAKLIEEAGLTSQIYLAGRIDSKLQLTYLRLADLYLCPQYFSELPQSLLLALSLGVPVSAYNQSALSGFFIPLAIPAPTTEEWQRVLGHWITDKKFARGMMMEAGQMASTFDQKKNTLEFIYALLMTGRSRPVKDL